MVIDNKRFCNLSSHTKPQNLERSLDLFQDSLQLSATHMPLTTFIRNSVDLRREKNWKIQTQRWPYAQASFKMMLSLLLIYPSAGQMRKYFWKLFGISAANDPGQNMKHLWIQSIFRTLTWGNMCRRRGRRTQSVMARQVHSWHIITRLQRWLKTGNCTSDWKWQTIRHLITDIYRI